MVQAALGIFIQHHCDIETVFHSEFMRGKKLIIFVEKMSKCELFDLMIVNTVCCCGIIREMIRLSNFELAEGKSEFLLK